MPVSAEVLVVGELSPEEAAELIDDFDAMGLTIDLREVPPRRSIGDIAWLALIAVPAKPFFEQLAKNSGDDAYRRLKTLVGKVGTALHRGETPSVTPKVLVLQDSTTGVQVILESDLPDEAHQQLLAFDLHTIRRGPLHYDRHNRRWRSELDEAESTPQPS